MATVVNLTIETFRSATARFRYWKVERDGFEGSGQTPQKALEEFRDAKRILDPADKEEYILPECNPQELAAEAA